jgi:hypothetical protein
MYEGRGSGRRESRRGTASQLVPLAGCRPLKRKLQVSQVLSPIPLDPPLLALHVAEVVYLIHPACDQVLEAVFVQVGREVSHHHLGPLLIAGHHATARSGCRIAVKSVISTFS